MSGSRSYGYLEAGAQSRVNKFSQMALSCNGVCTPIWCTLRWPSATFRCTHPGVALSGYIYDVRVLFVAGNRCLPLKMHISRNRLWSCDT